MERITAARAAELAGAELAHGPAENEADRVERDSREADDGSIFIALRGEKHDANDYVEQAYENGCRIFVISSETALEKLTAHDDASVIMTEDTHQALYTMAKNYLAGFDVLKFAVTGSAGKTTTKDMLKAMLSRKYRTIANYKNYNNDIGVSLTAFEVDSSTEAAIFEMGMNHAGEIHLLADIVRPDIACITNVGTAHIGNLGSRENIFRAKMEITDFMDENSTLVYNIDNDMLAKLKDKDTAYKKLACGYDAEQDGVIMVIMSQGASEGIVEASPGASGEEGISFILRYNGENMMFYLPILGVHNASNAAVACGCAVTAGVSLADCSDAMMDLDLTEGRMSITRSGSLKIIDDTYNANPDAMKAAVDALASTYGKRRVAVLADMLELGGRSEEFHRKIGSYVAEKGINVLAAVGSQAAYMADSAEEEAGDRIKTYRFKDADDFAEHAADILEAEDIVLVKGSHSMHTADIVDFLRKYGAEMNGEEQKDE